MYAHFFFLDVFGTVNVCMYIHLVQYMYVCIFTDICQYAFVFVFYAQSPPPRSPMLFQGRYLSKKKKLSLRKTYIALYIGLFCSNIGFFCENIGLFCGNIGLFCGDISFRIHSAAS